jgi:IS605 OrfB family transposase
LAIERVFDLVARIAKLHTAVANVRRDGLHKLTTRLVREHGTMVIEDFHVAGMLRNRRLARRIAGVGMAELRRQIEYKTGWTGSTLYLADRWYPSSKTCSGLWCGENQGAPVRTDLPLRGVRPRARSRSQRRPQPRRTRLRGHRWHVPLHAMIAPEESSQMMQSLISSAQEGGWLPKWPVANGYVDVMNGDAADPVIASAYAFGARDFDTNAALAATVKGATVPQNENMLGQGYYEQRPGLADYLKLGYVHNTRASSIPDVHNGASETLEYALADFSISRFAKAPGQHSTADEFLGRSQNCSNLLNTGSGFLQPRDGNGDFPAGNPVTTGMARFGQSGFQEVNAAQYASGWFRKTSAVCPNTRSEHQRHPAARRILHPEQRRSQQSPILGRQRSQPCTSPQWNVARGPPALAGGGIGSSSSYK